MVGSCSTLVAQTIQSDNNKFLDRPLVAECLLSAILIDTFNLDLHTGRTTEQDVFTGEMLSGHTEINSNVLFEEIQKGKKCLFPLKWS